jgi:PAS domain S-box-containing protein
MTAPMTHSATDYTPDALFRMSPAELNTVQEGVLITDANGTILALNDAFASISGFTREETLGRTCRFFQGPETDQQVLNSIRLAQKNGTVFFGEILNYRKNYSAFWNELTIFPWRNHRNEVTHFVGVIKDITQRKLGSPSPELATATPT